MEKKSRAKVWMALLAVALVSVVGITKALVSENKNADEQNAPDAVFDWTEPTTGTPVDHYVAQVLVNDQDTLDFDSIPTESFTFPVLYGTKYQVRVAGVDAAGNQGPYSNWSLPYNPELDPPGF